MKKKTFEHNKVGCDDCQRRATQRRSVLKTVLGLGVSLPFLELAAAAAKDPAATPPTAAKIKSDRGLSDFLETPGTYSHVESAAGSSAATGEGDQWSTMRCVRPSRR